MKEISPEELKNLKDHNAVFQLIDVREPHEIEIASIGGENIPMGQVLNNLDKIRKNNKVIVYCRSGKRSASIVNVLEQNGYTEVYNLTGGILAYAEKVDNSLQRY